MAHRLPGGLSAVARVGVLGVVTALLYAFALFVVFGVIGAETSPAQAIVVSASGALGAALALAPSGFGFREGTAAGLAVLVGVDPASAFAASALLHIAMLGFLIACAAYLATSQRPKPISQERLN